MATYLVVPDDYAGWNPTGRNFALISAGAAVIGLSSWIALHHHLGRYYPRAASDQIFLSGLIYLGAGGFILMMIAAFGSISLTLKSRGTVDVTTEGVTRVLGKQIQMLSWDDIEGLVPMPQGGVTLVSGSNKRSIMIPRFLDDYRACIAEIKSHGIQRISSSRLHTRQKTSWKSVAANAVCVFCYLNAIDPHESHHMRIFAFLTAGLFSVWILQESEEHVMGQRVSFWFGVVAVLCIAVWTLWRMAHTW
jgi:hypothetical protein